MKIKTVTIIGATGNIGANIAGIFASFGDAKVYLLGRDIEKVKNVIPKIIKSIRSDSIADKLIPNDYSCFDKCVSESDLIFDSLPEDIELKRNIARQISKYMRDDAISCTGTSGLSVTEISKFYLENQRERFFGMHFFNPPYSMPLCELIYTKDSNAEIMQSVSKYLEEILFRTVIEIQDSPAFLANRLGFYFINEAARYADKYSAEGGIDYIDYLLGTHTGRIMPPLSTADFVGLDVYKAIMENLYDHTYERDCSHNSFRIPKYMDELINCGRLGNKKHEGLYKTEQDSDGITKKLVWDIENKKYREVRDYKIYFVEEIRKYIADGEYKKALSILVNENSKEADICVLLLLEYIVYSVFLAKELNVSLDCIDDAMAIGFNCCPPQALYSVLSETTDVDMLIMKKYPELFDMTGSKELKNIMKTSRYDYKKFFRAL